MSPIRALLPLLLVTLAAACGPADSRATNEAAATPPPALTVVVAEVAPHPLARIVVGDGSVVAWQELAIGAEAGGLRVAEVAIDEGDQVRAGQLLVRLDDSVLQAQLAQAEAAATEAEASLRLAESELDRAQDLARSGTAARRTLDERQAGARGGAARLASARARVEELRARIAQTRIAAPTDGYVTRRTVQLGNVVASGQELLRLVRDGRLELDARVPELELAALRPGQKARVLHGARVIEAELRAVAPTVSPETRLGTAHVALPADAGLLPGMFARAEITAGAAPVLTVPQEAIVFRDGAPAAFVVQADGRVALRPLATGARREGRAEVREGLAAGERVVVAGAGFLSDGDRVRVQTADAGAR